MAMMKDIFFFYYFLSYSAGIPALFFAIYLFLSDKEILSKKYLFLTGIFFLFICLGTVANYLPDGFSYSQVKTVLFFLIFACSCFMVYLLPEFINTLYQIPFKKTIDRIFLFLAGFSVIVLTGFGALGRLFFLVPFILSLVGAAIIYCLVSGVIIYRKNLRSRTFYFMQTVGLITLVLLPLILLLDLFRSRIFPDIPVNGPLVLPLLYFIWNMMFIRSALKTFLSKKRMVIEVSPDFAAEYKISRREKEIIELLMQGKSYREITEILFLSMPTVKTHVSSIYYKTGTKSKMELASRIRELSVSQSE